MRQVKHTYQDPLDVVWVQTAIRLGMRIERADDVFASWDGHDCLRLGTSETLDADDCLAQMIFHEVCHALTEGPEAMALEDWGLENDEPAHVVREHACLRLQAALADRFGLRDLLAATTDFRCYYDNLPVDPLAPGPDPAIELARAAMQRALDGPWSEPLRLALEATAALAIALQPFAPGDSLWSRFRGSPR
jgi:hypothetical protein